MLENPMKVVRNIEHAVMNTKPEIRYRPGWQSKLFFIHFLHRSCLVRR